MLGPRGPVWVGPTQGHVHGGVQVTSALLHSASGISQRRMYENLWQMISSIDGGNNMPPQPQIEEATKDDVGGKLSTEGVTKRTKV